MQMKEIEIKILNYKETSTIKTFFVVNRIISKLKGRQQIHIPQATNVSIISFFTHRPKPNKQLKAPTYNNNVNTTLSQGRNLVHILQYQEKGSL